MLNAAIPATLALVPPLATANAPAKVTAPVVAVEGVKPVVPALNEVTATLVGDDQVGTPAAAEVRNCPLVPAGVKATADPVP